LGAGKRDGKVIRPKRRVAKRYREPLGEIRPSAPDPRFDQATVRDFTPARQTVRTGGQDSFARTIESP
jgi:hypothetical protein